MDDEPVKGRLVVQEGASLCKPLRLLSLSFKGSLEGAYYMAGCTYTPRCPRHGALGPTWQSWASGKSLSAVGQEMAILSVKGFRICRP